MAMGMGGGGGGGVLWSRLLRHITRRYQHFTAINRPPLCLTESPPPPPNPPSYTSSIPTSNAVFFNRSRMRTISPFSTAANDEDDGDDDGDDIGDFEAEYRREMRRRVDDDDAYDSDLPDVFELLKEIEKQEKQKAAESEERKLKGGEEQEQKEDEEESDYMGLGVISKGKEEEKGKRKAQGSGRSAVYWSDEDDDEYLDPAEQRRVMELEVKQLNQYQKRIWKYNELLESFRKSGTVDEAYKWMDQIDRFQEEHFAPSNEYKVLGWLLNRLSEATGKERFILQMKVQRGLKHLQWKAEFDPHNLDNWGIMKSEKEKFVQPAEEAEEDKEGKKENKEKEGDHIEGDQIEEIFSEDEYSSDEDIEEAVSEEVRSIDKEIKRKLAEMELTFGKQSRDLEEEIKELVGQRQSLTVKKNLPLYRKGFDVKLIDVNRTCKVTKGGQVHKYSAIVAVGNFNGIVGYGKAKGRAVAAAIQRAHVKSFENLHYIERYKEHTIAHAIQAKFKKTKIYLWPGAINTGRRANKTVESILYLAGIRNIKTKVIGSRNAENTVKAIFKALYMIETPQDVQEKFGRTVVESYLLK